MRRISLEDYRLQSLDVFDGRQLGRRALRVARLITRRDIVNMADARVSSVV